MHVKICNTLVVCNRVAVIITQFFLVILRGFFLAISFDDIRAGGGGGCIYFYISFFVIWNPFVPNAGEVSHTFGGRGAPPRQGGFSWRPPRLGFFLDFKKGKFGGRMGMAVFDGFFLKGFGFFFGILGGGNLCGGFSQIWIFTLDAGR